jgi:hypothetical protein
VEKRHPGNPGRPDRVDIADAEPLLELNTENSRIALGGAAGTIDLLIDATTTAAMDWSTAIYDLEIILADASVKRLVYGSVSVSPEVTR